MAVVAAGKLDHLVTARDCPGYADCAHRCFRARVDEPHTLDRRDQPTHPPTKLDFDRSWRTEARSAAHDVGEGAGQLSRGVPMNQRSPRHHEVEIDATVDIFESGFEGPSAVIKSHHNVGGLPKDLGFELVEPLRLLFKDEVRKIGKELGLPDAIIHRQPFPGPGLAVRILGEVTPENLEVLRRADAVVQEEIRHYPGYRDIWQSFAVLLPVRTVGVQGDSRTYENVVALRIVQSEDGMTADWTYLPEEILKRMSSRIVNEVQGVNRSIFFRRHGWRCCARYAGCGNYRTIS